jgi:hypothetical protein
MGFDCIHSFVLRSGAGAETCFASGIELETPSE